MIKMILATAAVALGFAAAPALAAQAPTPTSNHAIKIMGPVTSKIGTPMAATTTVSTPAIVVARKNGGGKWKGNKSRRSNKIGKGVAIGAAAAVLLGIAASSANADNGSRCDRLEWKCDDGQRWACRKYDRVCD